MKATEQIKRAAFEKTFDYFLSDPEHNVVKIMDLLDKVAPDNLFASQRQSFRNAIDNKDNWFQLIMRILNDTNPKVRDTLLKTFVIDGNLMAWPKQEENRDKYQCNIPWAILLDPTSACNLHCQGCWAAEYGKNQNLSFDEIDSIIQKGKELGIFTEVVPHGTELERAWEFARELMKKAPSRMVRRMTRETFTQPLREEFTKYIRSSLCHECYSSELRQDADPEAGHQNMVNKEK